MKILRLKFRNINSLAGDWEIDFSRREFTDNGLFAITGSTGSGKSSILDAIALALYGRTPRVNVTGSDNDVMTRGTSDCYAEICFESGGKIHKSSWKQERTRRGNLKPVQRSVAAADDTIVADQINACNSAIVRILGLTFEQFTKVILLAQGSFAAFLQANKDDKGDLLEQITGTEIYGEISRTVFERNKMEIQRLELIDRELEAISVLADEEVQILRDEIAALGSQKEQITKELEAISASQNLLRELSSLNKQIEGARAKLPELIANEASAKTAFEQSEKDLEILRREEAMIAPIFVKIRELDTKLSERNVALNSTLESLKGLKEEKNKLDDRIGQQRKDQTEVLAGLKDKEARRIELVRYESLVENYSAINSQNSQVEKRLSEWNQKRSEADRAAKILIDKTSDCKTFEMDFDEKHRLLEAKRQDMENRKKKLNELLAGKELPVLQSEKESIKDCGIKIRSLSDNLKESLAYKHDIELCEGIVSDNSACEEAANADILRDKNVLKGLKNQMDLLRENISLARTIQSLEAHRKKLEDGKECPLCGSAVHPFAAGNLPVTDENERRLQALSKEFDETEKAVKTSEKMLAKATSDRENAERNKENLQKQLRNNALRRTEILSELEGFSIDFEGEDQGLARLEELRIAKLAEWQSLEDVVKAALQIEVSIAELRDKTIPQYQHVEKIAEGVKVDAETARKLAEKAVETSEDLVHQTKAQYEVEKAALRSKLAEYEVENTAQLKGYRDLWIANEDSLTRFTRQALELDGKIKLTESQIEENQRRLLVENTEKEKSEAIIQELAEERVALFGEKKVDAEERALRQRIGEAERAKSSKEKAKNEAYTELEKTKAIILECEKRLSARQSETVSERTSEELQAEYDDKQGESDVISQKIGANKQALDANDENLERNRNKLSERAVQALISKRWKGLDALIGSSDGKKYRNFAQALTFESLIVQANRQLRKMSERYILKRSVDGGSPFELSVIDKFRNCDERTARNLSGGEKFIVSLSLALGLANMASRNMKIDTMFIDEGFGTLDSDYLNVALTALSNLQSEGKLIGVISHLAELKERIVTHIEVVPLGDGRSRIEIG
ncbi:MAG: AAA family ATPase [Prevotellaceae bacterium]|jgi:exonuclease SbcC|nr:AAA family ATPase [Prevotellaceae bacterium]